LKLQSLVIVKKIDFKMLSIRLMLMGI